MESRELRFGHITLLPSTDKFQVCVSCCGLSNSGRRAGRLHSTLPAEFGRLSDRNADTRCLEVSKSQHRSVCDHSAWYFIKTMTSHPFSRLGVEQKVIGTVPLWWLGLQLTNLAIISLNQRSSPPKFISKWQSQTIFCFLICFQNTLFFLLAMNMQLFLIIVKWFELFVRRKNVKHILIPASQIWGLAASSLFYMTVNWILGFGLTKHLEGSSWTLGNMRGIFFPKNL